MPKDIAIKGASNPLNFGSLPSKLLSFGNFRHRPSRYINIARKVDVADVEDAGHAVVDVSDVDDVGDVHEHV